MKHSKAFILVEILTGMALQAGFIIALCTSFYLMLSFYTRTQQTLSARQNAERVIAYVDSRIRNADLGLWKCESSSEIRDALSQIDALFKDDSNNYQKFTFPVAVTSGNWKLKSSNSDNKFTGNRLTLLYTQRPSKLNLVIRTSENNETSISGDNVPMILSSDVPGNSTSVSVGFISKTNHSYNESEFNKVKINLDRMNYLSSYTVMSGTGRPLFIGNIIDNDIKKIQDEGIFTLSLLASSGTSPKKYVNIYPGDELLYLKCERMFVEGTNFKFQEFNGASWGDATPAEMGILEIYFELDTSKNILDMYVLSSGGINDLNNTQKPSSWPGTWKNEYANYIVHMSRASWKLKNLPDSFRWN